MREMQIFDFKKKIAEAETKLKQQQNLYEAVRSDRNLYSKNLIESQVCYTDNVMHRCAIAGQGGGAMAAAEILLDGTQDAVFIQSVWNDIAERLKGKA